MKTKSSAEQWFLDNYIIIYFLYVTYISPDINFIFEFFEFFFFFQPRFHFESSIKSFTIASLIVIFFLYRCRNLQLFINHYKFLKKE